MEHRVDQLSKKVLEAVRQNLGAEDEHDTSKDSEINTMSNFEILSSFLEWEGICDYQYIIKSAIESIYKIKLEDK